MSVGPWSRPVTPSSGNTANWLTLHSDPFFPFVSVNCCLSQAGGASYPLGFENVPEIFRRMEAWTWTFSFSFSSLWRCTYDRCWKVSLLTACVNFLVLNTPEWQHFRSMLCSIHKLLPSLLIRISEAWHCHPHTLRHRWWISKQVGGGGAGWLWVLMIDSVPKRFGR